MCVSEEEREGWNLCGESAKKKGNKNVRAFSEDEALCLETACDGGVGNPQPFSFRSGGKSVWVQHRFRRSVGGGEEYDEEDSFL